MDTPEEEEDTDEGGAAEEDMTDGRTAGETTREEGTDESGECTRETVAAVWSDAAQLTSLGHVLNYSTPSSTHISTTRRFHSLARSSAPLASCSIIARTQSR